MYDSAKFSEGCLSATVCPVVEKGGLIGTKLRVLAAAAIILMGIAPSAGAGTIGPTVGVAVNAVGSLAPAVGITEDRAIGDDAIKYFIPLGDGSGTYGTTTVDWWGRVTSPCGATGFGTCADSGDGGGKLTMILRFSPVSTTAPSRLSVLFEDLDLNGANDPSGFLESLNVLTASGNSLTNGWITSIGGLITGNNDRQALNLSLGTLTATPLFLVLNFKVVSHIYGTNTPEYLIATVTDIPTSPVPLAPMPLSVTFVLALSGWYVWRRRQAHA
jgi:hypothetical protein